MIRCLHGAKFLLELSAFSTKKDNHSSYQPASSHDTRLWTTTHRTLLCGTTLLWWNSNSFLVFFSVSFFYWNRQIQTNSQRNAFPAWPLSRKLGHPLEHRRLRRQVLDPQRTNESPWPPRWALEKGASPCQLIHLRGLHIQPQGIKSPLQARRLSFLLQLLNAPLVIISLLSVPSL